MQPRHKKLNAMNGMVFGVPYYPEHWGSEETRSDATLMRDAGVNTVRMAEFAWDIMEPEPGRFDFSLFDQTIGNLAEEGIRTILCTPTAAPPVWLIEQNPEILRVDENSRHMQHGSRQHACTTNPVFRKTSRRITRAMAEHFKHFPSVIGWQTDNELNCHFSECHCSACQIAFREWCKQRYENIEKLNLAWGTAFWAQTYSSFDQLSTPKANRPAYENPAHRTDYYRFLSDSVIRFQAEQVTILKDNHPGWFVFHNGLFNNIDYWRFAADLDCMGVDIYPGFPIMGNGSYVDAGRWAAAKLQECRAVSGSFIVPELQGGAGGQKPYLHETPLPGQMRLWAYQGLAHGADGIMHFRWRTCRFGAEIYWNGIIGHDNVPRRRYQEFAQEGQEFKELAPLLANTSYYLQIGILIDYNQTCIHRAYPMGLPSPDEQASLLLEAMLSKHLPAGLVNANDALDGLGIVFVPSFRMVSDELLSRLEDFAGKGGTVVFSADTFTRTAQNSVIASTPPGPATEFSGVSVTETSKTASGQVELLCPDDTRIPALRGYEILDPADETEVIAVWRALSNNYQHPAENYAGITLRKHGKGLVWYCGTWFDKDNVDAILMQILNRTPQTALVEADAAIEATIRIAENSQPLRRLLFLLNHADHPCTVHKHPAGKFIIGENAKQKQHATEGPIQIEAFGVRVIELK